MEYKLDTKLEYKNNPCKAYCKYIKILKIDKKNKKALLYIYWKNCFTRKYYNFDYMDKIFIKKEYFTREDSQI
jgi:hypothetical protein